MVRFLYSAFSDESGEATLQGQIDACKRNGITHMELRGFGKDPNINNITTEKAKELRAILDKNGMRLSAIGSAYEGFRTAAETKRDKHHQKTGGNDDPFAV